MTKVLFSKFVKRRNFSVPNRGVVGKYQYTKTLQSEWFDTYFGIEMLLKMEKIWVDHIFLKTYCRSRSTILRGKKWLAKITE